MSGFDRGGNAGAPQQQESASSTSGHNATPGKNPLMPQGPTAPAISLPVGGGAIRNMGEKFSVSPATGTASAQVPIPLSAGRDSHGPGSLNLEYSSDSGNGPWGIGWKMSLGVVSRKTDKGTPRYDNGDVFLFHGVEDLVPRCRTNLDGTLAVSAQGKFDLHVEERDGWKIERFAPRIESKFVRIEKWTSAVDSDDIHWKATNTDGAVSLFGLDDSSRIYDTSARPGPGKKIFSWHLCQTYDLKGNCALYSYKREDSSQIDVMAAYETHRTPESRRSNLYLKSIRYGNRQPNRDPSTWKPFDATQLQTGSWIFEAVLDYGEHDVNDPKADDAGPLTWPCRLDPFSTYRSSFDVRTYRLCRRILMFHHFPQELGRNDCLISSTIFHYDENTIATYLVKVTRTGYRLRNTDITSNSASPYVVQDVPALEFEYSRLPTPEELESTPVRSLSEEALEGFPVGFQASYQPVDLDGEGLSGVLFESNNTWYYKRNVSANNTHAATDPQSKNSVELTPMFRPPVALPVKPNASVNDSFQLLSLTGSGQLEIAEMAPGSAGFYQRSSRINDGVVSKNPGWESFSMLPAFPNVTINDPNTKLVDLTGDGLADILISEDGKFIWYESVGENGFLPGEIISQPLDEKDGPRILFSDPEHTIFLADMSGDGMQDIVRISNPGSVCYWPSLGYGRFGAKVNMANLPPLDRSDQFDAKRIRLIDIDGSGTTDIMYLATSQIKIHRNMAGNSWSTAQPLGAVPHFDNLVSAQTIDLLGRGTACLVWSDSGPSASRQPVRYLDLMNDTKPHLLIRAWNNLGAETKYTYTPSTQFYLSDEAAGRPWITRVHFPVQCVSKIETYDAIGRSRFISEYAYHHGYYDPTEREFRGFALAEQWDTEKYASLDSSGSDEVSNWDAAFHSPPVHTKQFFHTGAYIDGEDIGILLAREFYGAPAPFDSASFADFVDLHNLKNAWPDSVAADDLREACRSFRGLPLREEVYCRDDGPYSDRPFTISSHSYSTTCIQPRVLDAKHSIWMTHPVDAMKFEYDREVSDPRITHTISLERNRFGADIKSLSIAYGRRKSDLTGYGKSVQEQTFITYSEQDFTNLIDQPDAYMISVPSENRAYELSSLELPKGKNFFQADFLSINDFEALTSLPAIASESTGNRSEKWKRLLHRQRILYRSDDLTRTLPIGRVDSMLLPAISYSLAFTPGMLDKFRGSGQNILPDISSTMVQGGYIDLDSDLQWWVPSGQQFFHTLPTATPSQELAEARLHFFHGKRYTDIFGSTTTLEHDVYDLLPITIIDPIGNVTRSVNDYRVMAPATVTDINGNVSKVAFDALGRVVGAAVMGKPGQGLGDSLVEFAPDLSDEDRDAFFKNPRTDAAHRLLGNASSRIIYDNGMYSLEPGKRRPAYSATIARETHVSDLSPGETTKVRIKFSYSDGFDREIQQKNMQEPGPVMEGGPRTENRWVATGWTIFNNKGKEVQKFEAFFDDTHEFNFAKLEGVSPIIMYDASQRPAVTLRPDHSWSKTVYGGWSQAIYDAGDLVSISDPRDDVDVGPLFKRFDTKHYLPSWYDMRQNGQKGANETAAAIKSAAYNDTPTIAYADSMGRSFMTTVDNGPNGKHTEMSIMDIEGKKLQSIDSLGRIVEQSEYNLLGDCYHGTSMDIGASWTLKDASNNTFLDWDGRLQRVRTSYDNLRRVKSHYLMLPGATSEVMADLIVYGEEVDFPEVQNARGKHYRQYDQSGILTMPTYDFKGNLLSQEQQFCTNYKSVIDWTDPNAVQLEPGLPYRSSSKYDALNRHTEGTTPDQTVTVNVFNEASYVEKALVNLRGELGPTNEKILTEFVTNVDYDAQGRRTTIQYGNGTTTTYEYNRLTSNLTHIRTSGPGGVVQDLEYTSDIVGNIVHIQDSAQQTKFFRNQVIDPSMDFTYDAIGRLIEARGRERMSVGNQAPGPEDSEATGLPSLAPNALATYIETYKYDSANNILEVKHSGSQAANPGWARRYTYDNPSQVDPSMKSNKLTGTNTGQGSEVYRYDGPEGSCGLMTSMSHLSSMTWDFRDQLRSTASQIFNNGTPETTYYVYDAVGQRVRKITERQSSGDEPPRKLKETLYLTGLDIFKTYAGDGLTVTLEKQTFKVLHADKNVALVETRTISTAEDTSNLPPERLIRYQLDNYLGSICVELDDNGGVLSYEEFSPYGTTTYLATKTELHIDKRYRFANKERDTETGLYSYGQRYYAPWIGRWISSDPAGTTADGLNVFCYVRCNPTRYRDSGGTKSEDWRDSLSWMQRAALKVDDWIQEHPGAQGVVNNLDKRGEALMNIPKALGQLAEKPAGEIVQTLGEGMVQFGKDTVKAGYNTAKYGYKAVTEGGDDNWRKFGDATTDFVLNSADVVTMVAGGAGAVKGAANLARAAKVAGEATLESAKATVKALPKVLAEAAANAPKEAAMLVASDGSVAMDGAAMIKNAASESKNILMMAGKHGAQGVKAAASAGGKAFRGVRQIQKLESAIKKLETGSSVMSRNYRYFKAGGQLGERGTLTFEEALEKVGGEVAGKLARHHDVPQTLQKLWDAVGYDNHASTHLINRRVHQLIHGMGGHFHDSNVLWAQKLANTDLRALNSALVDTIRQDINATFKGALENTTKVKF